MAANIRPIPTTTYYSGQGRFGMGLRDATTGRFDSLLFLGNCTSVAFDNGVQKSDHKESMTGNRAIDLTLVQTKTLSFKVEVESMSLALLEVGLWGTQSTTAGATVTAEPHKIKKGQAIPLKYPNVSSVVVKKAGTAISGASWDYDAKFGTVYIAAGASDVVDDDILTVDYTYGASSRLEAFTSSTMPERYLRFEGLNTVDGSARIVEAMRAVFEPMTGLEMINDDVAKGTLNGTLYPDLTVTTGGLSQYYRDIRA